MRKKKKYSGKIVTICILTFKESRAEEGCIGYEYSFGVDDDEHILTEVWRDAQVIELHKSSEHFARLGGLKAEYV